MDPRPQLDTRLFLPTSRKEMERLGWDCLDVILVSGDAYVDHPSFATAVIGRVIQAEGFRVGIIPQPDWRGDAHELCRLGRPRLFFGVSGGNMDPMVNHYTAARRRRSDDAFTPGGKSGARPDYATSVYTQTLKRLYPDVPVVIGGIEASMRRLAHYDYWQDKLLPSILTQSGADLLVYGMGEKPFRDILSLLGRGVPFTSLKTIPQTAFLWQSDAALPKNKHWEDLELPSYETCREDKRAFAQASRIIEVQSNRLHAARLAQRTGEQTVVVNPPYPPMSTAELDAVYELPFTRLPNPRYAGKGEIPAYRMIRHSITIHRGCFGGCAFCTISAHQGKFVTPRSEASVLRVVERVAAMREFRGSSPRLGGPRPTCTGWREETAPCARNAPVPRASARRCVPIWILRMRGCANSTGGHGRSKASSTSLSGRGSGTICWSRSSTPGAMPGTWRNTWTRWCATMSRDG